MPAGLNIPKEELTKLCRQYGIRRLSVFGSVLRDDFRPDSDVDILIEFEPGISAGFFRLHEIQEKISALLENRNIDLVNPKFLNHLIKKRILDSSEVVYG